MTYPFRTAAAVICIAFGSMIHSVEAAPSYRLVILYPGAAEFGALTNSGNFLLNIGRPSGKPTRVLASISGQRELFKATGNHVIFGQGMTDAGDIVGTVRSTAATFKDGHAHPIATPADGTWARFFEAGDVNDAGQIAGFGRCTIDGKTHAFLYQNGIVTDVGRPQAEGFSGWKGIPALNNSGQFVLTTWMYHGGFNTSAMLFDGTAFHEITPNDGTFGMPSDINDRGQVVGWLGNPDRPRAFLYEAGVLRVLGKARQSTEARAINNSGLIVGDSGTEDRRHAFLYAHGRMYDLNSLVTNRGAWVITSAEKINDTGTIGAIGHLPDGRIAALILKPSRAGASR